AWRATSMLVPQAKGFPLFCSGAAAFAPFCELFVPLFGAVCGAGWGFCPWVSKVCATHAVESASMPAKTGANEDNSRTLTRDEEIFTLAFFTALFKTGLDSEWPGVQTCVLRIQQL